MTMAKSEGLCKHIYLFSLQTILSVTLPDFLIPCHNLPEPCKLLTLFHRFLCRFVCCLLFIRSHFFSHQNLSMRNLYDCVAPNLFSRSPLPRMVTGLCCISVDTTGLHVHTKRQFFKITHGTHRNPHLLKIIQPIPA